MAYQADKKHLFRMTEHQASIIIDALRYSTDPDAGALGEQLSNTLQLAQQSDVELTWDLS